MLPLRRQAIIVCLLSRLESIESILMLMRFGIYVRWTNNLRVIYTVALYNVDLAERVPLQFLAI